ncbi:hypothetical protein Dimus_028654, partial [Dionaea muscipula]
VTTTTAAANNEIRRRQPKSNAVSKVRRFNGVRPCSLASILHHRHGLRNGVSASSTSVHVIRVVSEAPVNYVCLRSVKPSLRPLSMAISTVSIHIFGDGISPLVGVLQLESGF